MKVNELFQVLHDLQKRILADRELKVIVSPSDIRSIIWVDEWFSNNACWMSVRHGDRPGGLPGHNHHYIGWTVAQLIEEICPLVDPEDGDYGDSEFYVLVADRDVRSIMSVDEHGIRVSDGTLSLPVRKISDMIRDLKS